MLQRIALLCALFLSLTVSSLVLAKRIGEQRSITASDDHPLRMQTEIANELKEQVAANIPDRKLQMGDLRAVYMVAWQMINVFCDGYVPIIRLGCANGGTVSLFYTNMTVGNGTQCYAPESGTYVDCVVDYDDSIVNATIVQGAFGFTCGGTFTSQLVGRAVSSAQELECGNADTGYNLGYHNLGILVFNFATSKFEVDFGCLSGGAPDPGCKNGTRCSAEGQTTCSAYLPAAGATQDYPLPSNAVA